jgi:hypothetical protein
MLLARSKVASEDWRAQPPGRAGAEMAIALRLVKRWSRTIAMPRKQQSAGT